MMLNLSSDRREFLRAALRLPVLAALGLLGVHLARRRLGAGPAAGCPRADLCQGCPALRDCGLDQALAYKKSAL